MPISRITKTSNGREAIAYAQNGRGHDGSKQRNAEIGCVNLTMGVDFADQMQPVWNRAIRRHKCQILRVIQSFSLDECDPNNPDDIHKANMIGQYFAKKYYPGRQAVVFTQIDGKGGKVHNHILISDVHMETYKGHTAEQTLYLTVEEWTRESAAQYLEKVRNPRKENQKTKDKVTQTERVKREKGQYVWKDSLKERILGAMIAATNETDFYMQLQKRGVTAQKHESKKHGTYFTYTLDKKYIPKDEKIPRNLSVRSYNLGAAYGYDAMVYTMQSSKGISAGQAGKASGTAGGTGRKKELEVSPKKPEKEPEQTEEETPAKHHKEAKKKQNTAQKQQVERKKSEEEIRQEELARWMHFMEMDKISRKQEPEQWAEQFALLRERFEAGERAPDGWKTGDPTYTEMEKKSAEEEKPEAIPNKPETITVNPTADEEARKKEERRRKLTQKAEEQQKRQVEKLRSDGKPIPANFEDMLRKSRTHEDHQMGE